jgi:hypothetical protein
MGKRIAHMLLTLTALAVALTAHAAAAARVDPTAIPDTLRVPAGNVFLFATAATGSQIYVCTAKTDSPDTFAWVFKAPQAELRNDAGDLVGMHSAGPTWAGNDGSAVVGEAVAHADGADAGAIPWLLLRATSHAGSGLFSTVTYVQRLETAGGVAPTEGCDQSTAGEERAVPYTATYAFYYPAAA